jgi:hypothetical protein
MMDSLNPKRMEKEIRIMAAPIAIVPMPTNVTVLEKEVSCVFRILRATKSGKFILIQG